MKLKTPINWNAEARRIARMVQTPRGAKAIAYMGNTALIGCNTSPAIMGATAAIAAAGEKVLGAATAGTTRVLIVDDADAGWYLTSQARKMAEAA